MRHFEHLRCKSTRKSAGRQAALKAFSVGAALVAGSTYAMAQVPNLGTAADFAVLAGSSVTNTGSTVLLGSVGVSPGIALGGFPPGIVLPPGSSYSSDAVALQAQIDLANGYNSVAGRPTTVDLTGQNLGGLTLTPGVYNFASVANLTGTLTLNALGNPNAVFIFNVGSALTTGSASTVRVIGGGTGDNVYWRVGSSATLGTTTTFLGDILALTSITLNTGANITCGSALARNGAVTLDSNNIATRNLTPACTMSPLLPTGTTPGATSVGAPAVAGAVNAAFVAAVAANGGALPTNFAQAFINLSALSPAQQSLALQQMSGESNTGVAQAGIQSMNSFLSMVLSPYPGNMLSERRGGFGPGAPVVVKALGFAEGRPKSTNAFASIEKASSGGFDPSRWSMWGASYGGQQQTGGDAGRALHDRSVRNYGFAAGADYRLLPDTVIGFALGGGGTNYQLSEGFGSGRSDMFQAAFYTSTRVNSAYVSAALAYAWHDVTTDQYLSVAGADHLTANFRANNVGGRIEGGYRIDVAGSEILPTFGITPYVASQGQAFFAPAYSENAESVFARAYAARTSTAFRNEVGTWFDTSRALADGAVVNLRTRAAWAHDEYSDPTISASFLTLSGPTFLTDGAAPARDLLLASAGAELSFPTGYSIGAQFDGEFGDRTTRYGGKGRLRYSW